MRLDRVADGFLQFIPDRSVVSCDRSVGVELRLVDWRPVFARPAESGQNSGSSARTPLGSSTETTWSVTRPCTGNGSPNLTIGKMLSPRSTCPGARNDSQFGVIRRAASVMSSENRTEPHGQLPGGEDCGKMLTWRLMIWRSGRRSVTWSAV